MLCQKCHKNLATVRYAEVVDGAVTDLHLCPECLAAHEKEIEGGFQLSGPVPSPNPAAFVEQTRLAAETCKGCGTMFSDVLNEGQVGCRQCYSAFRDKLVLAGGPDVKMRHAGKAPKISDTRARIRGELQVKRGLLRTSLELERYEEAAVLRDEIHNLEVGLSASAAGED